MRAWLTIGAVLLGALPARAQIMIYDSSPRIIQVPQADAVAAPVDHERARRAEPKPQPRRTLAKAATEPAPRPRAELPPPRSEPKRAVLSAPTPSYGPGSLTPIYPTPRWRNADPPPLSTADNNE